VIYHVIAEFHTLLWLLSDKYFEKKDQRVEILSGEGMERCLVLFGGSPLLI
jgi:hypothetical protein